MEASLLWPHASSLCDDVNIVATLCDLSQHIKLPIMIFAISQSCNLAIESIGSYQIRQINWLLQALLPTHKE